jgi:hexosaminidase
MRRLTLLAILFVSGICQAQLNIIPQPSSVKMPKIAGKFTINPATVIVLEGSKMDNSINFLNNYLQRFYYFKLKILKSSLSKNAIRLNYERMDSELPGAYRMTVDSKGVYIAGDNAEGVFYGIQTLIQLLPLWDPRLSIPNKQLSIPYASIEDAPRFEYRGLHLDVGRHFMPVDFIKKYIDYIALHKMNYFHWHLTEDQGWRMEIKGYPELTSKGGWRNGTIIGRYPGKGNDGIKYGGYYTQDEVKEIVAYAQQRYITVVPEIEMPGHSSAAIAAYPDLSCFPGESTQYPKQCAWNGDTTGKQVQQTWGVFDDVFCAGKDNTFNFLENVLDQVVQLFPSTYIHVGGDECPKSNWKRCRLCQKRMKDNNLKDEHELQSYFIQRIEKYLNAKGRKLIGWDEILEGGLAPNAAVMSWRGEDGGIAAAKQNHDVVMTPGGWCYFDHSQSENEDSVTIGGFTPVEKVYGYEPVPATLNEDQAKHILGAQANVWTEYMKNTRKVEYMIFPRLSAISEVLWTAKSKKNWSDFERRLMTQFKRYDLWKNNYSHAYFDLRATVVPGENNTGLVWKLETKLKDTRISYMNEISPLMPYTKPIPIKNPRTFNAVLTDTDNKELASVTQKFIFNRATGKKITLTKEASKKYPGDGAFTLVNGVVNEKGMARTREFLGFEGTDCEAIINLDSFQTVTSVSVHIFQQQASWIWQPSSVEALISDDGQYFSSLGKTDKLNIVDGNNGTMSVKGTNTGRYVKVIIRNWGPIPEGNPGAGNKAWLFVDEIEINGPAEAGIKN